MYTNHATLILIELFLAKKILSSYDQIVLTSRNNKNLRYYKLGVGGCWVVTPSFIFVQKGSYYLKI